MHAAKKARTIRGRGTEGKAIVMGVLARHTQIYVQYMRILELQYYSDYGISGGVRFQF